MSIIKRIDITERNETLPSYLSSSSSAVYVPGIATDGPVGVPTYLQRESDLTTTFGDSAVQFEGESGKNGIVDYSEDLSYVYARFLLKQGIPVFYERVTATNTVDAIYEALSASDSDKGFKKLSDIGDYNIKFITSGAYPSYYCDEDYESSDSEEISYNDDIMKIMIDVAKTRGDAVALIDHQNVDESDLDITNDDICKSVVNSTVDDGEYGAMFTPWANYSMPLPFGDQIMPASFGYLVAYAKSVRTNASYLAVAGVARGQVPYIENLDTKRTLTNAMADSYQDTSKTGVNAITKINPYDLTIWGNRTLYKNNIDLDAYSYLNLRSLMCDLKKSLRDVALTLLFEQNNDILWLKFKSRITPVLDRMVAGSGISNYTLIKSTVDASGNPISKYRLAVEVVINPTYPVEAVSIGVVVTDEDVTVA